MPAAPESIRQEAVLPTFLNMKTSDAPAAVMTQVKSVATSACAQPGNCISQSKEVISRKTVFLPYYAVRNKNCYIVYRIYSRLRDIKNYVKHEKHGIT